MKLPIPQGGLPFVPTLLGAAAVVTLLGGAGGFWLGHGMASASGDADLAQLKAGHTAALVVASEQARAKERKLNLAANELRAQLDAERRAHALESNQLKGRIPRVTTQYRPAPDAPLQPAPRCLFTHGFASVWNGAIGANGGTSVPAAAPAGGAAAAPDTAEALDSGIQQADVLAHVIDYGARCRDIESQLNRLIDWHLKLETP